MVASVEPRSGLLHSWGLGAQGWNTDMDNNLLHIGRFGFHLSVKDKDLVTPPVSPTAGDSYIVPSAPTGAWVGQTGKVAVWSGTAWVFGTPRIGWVAYIEDEEKLSAYKAAGWSAGVAL